MFETLERKDLEGVRSTSSGVAELKSLVEDGNRTIASLREKTDELSQKYDGVTLEVTRKIEAAVADILKKQSDANAEMKARADDLEAAMNRPGKGGAKGADDDYSKAMRGYLRKGTEADEIKSMATSSNVDGGFLIAPTMRDGIMARLRRASPVRSVATVVQSPIEYRVPIERGDAGYEWAGETEERNETATPTIGMISIPTHELSAKPKVSQRMLDTAEFDIEAFLSGRVANRFARAEGKAFVSGNGIAKPKGFLSYSVSDKADDERSSEVLQYRVTGGAGDFAASGPADVLVKTLYDLQGPYQANASWMMKNTTAASVATLKDGQGRYLLQTLMDGQGGVVTTVLGRPLTLADDMPKIAANSLSIAIGDFEMGYTITESGSIVVLRDPYTQKPFVQFYTTVRVGGGVSDFDAIKLIKFASS